MDRTLNQQETFADISCVLAPWEKGLYQSINNAGTFFALFDCPEVSQTVALDKKIKFTHSLYGLKDKTESKLKITFRKYSQNPEFLFLGAHHNPCADNVTFTVYSGYEQCMHGIKTIDARKLPPDDCFFKNVQPFRNNQYLIKIEI